MCTYVVKNKYTQITQEDLDCIIITFITSFLKDQTEIINWNEHVIKNIYVLIGFIYFSGRCRHTVFLSLRGSNPNDMNAKPLPCS